MEDLSRNEFSEKLKGKRIKEINYSDNDGLFDVSDEICIESIVFEDGSKLYLHGSFDIDISGVWGKFEEAE